MIKNSLLFFLLNFKTVFTILSLSDCHHHGLTQAYFYPNDVLFYTDNNEEPIEVFDSSHCSDIDQEAKLQAPSQASQNSQSGTCKG